MLCKICVKRAAGPGTAASRKVAFFWQQKKARKENCRCFDAADPRLGGCTPPRPPKRKSEGAGAKRKQYYFSFLTPPPLPPLLSRVFPRTPAGVNGCSVGAAYMPPAAYRDNPSTGKGEGCRPPLPLSFATHLWQSVGAGHARPAALLCHPFAFCIVGRGLDPSAASRRREPQKPLRPSLPLGHLPCEGRLLSRAPPAQKAPLSKGAVTVR